MNCTNLKNARKKAGYMQREVAEILNFGKPATVSAWETGENTPTIETIIKLAKLYDCDAAYLIGEQETPVKAYTEYGKYTGLSDKAIEKLHNAKINNSPFLDVLSVLIEHENALETMAAYALDTYSGTYTFAPYDREDGKKEILDHEMIDRANKLYILDSIIEVLDNYRKQYTGTKEGAHGNR